MKLISFLIVSIFMMPVFAQYWQQEVHSTIDVELFPDEKILRGDITIDYYNHSPNVLDEIYIHLWPNAYSTKESAFAEQLLIQGKKSFYLSEQPQGSISGLQFFVDNISTEWQVVDGYADIAILTLNSPLQANDSIQIRTSFEVKIPPMISRMGYDGDTFSLTQWYPKPAVYDNTGWHPMPYLDQGEFYNEFGNYDVSITLPSHYVVAGSGILQNTEEIKWLSQLAQATQEGINNNYNLDIAKAVKQRQGKKTIQFIQQNITDFAWFASPDFFTLSDSIKTSKDNVLLQSFFTENDVFVYEKAIELAEGGLHFYSSLLDDYPFSEYKMVSLGLTCGMSAGMEYPGLSVVAPFSNELQFKKTILHELGHNYFQASVSSNERNNPWMDEGFTTYITELALANEIGVETIDFSEYDNQLALRHSLLDLPSVNRESTAFHKKQYGLATYIESAKHLNYLFDYLGKEQLKTYYQQWKNKHVSPNDFYDFMQTEQLPKEIIKALFSGKKADFKLQKVTPKTISITNKSEHLFPVRVDYLNQQDEVFFSEYVNGFANTITIENKHPEAHSIALFHHSFLVETNRANNRQGLNLDVITPLSPLQKGFGSHESNQLFVSPLLGWNAYDQLMIGGTISNTSLLQKPFEYQLIPMYATNTQDIVGMGKVEGHFNSQSSFMKQVSPFLTAQHFNQESERFELDYYRNEIGVAIDFEHQKEKQANNITKQLKTSMLANTVEPIPFFDVSTGKFIDKKVETEWYYNLSYARENNRLINPNQLSLQAQVNESFVRLSGTYSYRYDFAKPGEYAQIRAFAGSLIHQQEDMPFAASFSAIGRNGTNDYDFSHLYFFRENTDNILGNVWHEADGALKSITNYANLVDLYGDNMFALNTEITLPIDLPAGKLMAFADTALFSYYFDRQDQQATILYDAGLSYKLGEIIQLYYPLFISDEFKPQNDIQPFGLKEKLVVQVNVAPLAWKQQLRELVKNK